VRIFHNYTWNTSELPGIFQNYTPNISELHGIFQNYTRIFQNYTLPLFSPIFHSRFLFAQIFQILDNFQCREILKTSTSRRTFLSLQLFQKCQNAEIFVQKIGNEKLVKIEEVCNSEIFHVILKYSECNSEIFQVIQKYSKCNYEIFALYTVGSA
jgi:hypothetical protein